MSDYDLTDLTKNPVFQRDVEVLSRIEIFQKWEKELGYSIGKVGRAYKKVKESMVSSTGEEEVAQISLPLTDAEKDELKSVEAEIHDGLFGFNQVMKTLLSHEHLADFAKVGRGLALIQKKRLYRQWGTFESYLKANFPVQNGLLSKSKAYHLIQAAAVVDNIQAHFDRQANEPQPEDSDEDTPDPFVPFGTNAIDAAILPQKEAHTRPLAELPAEEQGSAWQEVLEETDGKPTQAEVQQVVDRRKQTEATPAESPPMPETEPVEPTGPDPNEPLPLFAFQYDLSPVQKSGYLVRVPRERHKFFLTTLTPALRTLLDSGILKFNAEDGYSVHLPNLQLTIMEEVSP